MRELNSIDPWGYFAESVHGGGRVVNWHELTIVTVLKDLGWLRSWSVFETMVARKEVVFHLEDYLERLCASIKTMHLKVPFGDDNFKGQLAEIVKEVLSRNNYRWRVCDQSLVKIIVTGGQTHDGFTPADFASLFIVSEKFKRPEFEGKGLNLICVKDQRPFPLIKTPGNYSRALSKLESCKNRSDPDNFCDDILYCDNDWNILETSRANIFIVQRNKIVTPRDGVLGGVTKKIVMGLSLSLGYTVEERHISCAGVDISLAEEIFISSTTKGVWPVTHISHTKTDFPVGHVTLKLRKAFLEYEEKYYQK